MPYSYKWSDLQKLAFFLIKNYSLQVLVDKQESRNYFSFSNWVDVWYVQKDNCWYSFSKSNIPNTDSGSGAQTFREVEAFAKYATATLSSHNQFLKDDKYKYKSVQQFINYEQRHWKDYWPITIEEIEQYIK